MDKLSELTRKGKCFEEAVKKITDSCSSVYEGPRLRFVLDLTNCFLESVGKPAYECPLDLDIRECTKDLTGDTWSTFTKFSVHADEICNFHKVLIWQKRSENLINEFSKRSENLAAIVAENTKQMEVNVEYSEKLLHNINVGMEASKLTTETINISRVEIESLHDKATSSYNKVLENIQSQKNVFLDIMDALAAQIRFLDDILYNEIIDINSIFWHACLAIISRMVMSTETLVHRKDFVAGRKDYFLCLISFVVIALNYLGERMLFGFLKASRVGSQTFYAFIERMIAFVIISLYIVFLCYRSKNKDTDILTKLDELKKNQNRVESTEIKEAVRSALLNLKLETRSEPGSPRAYFGRQRRLL